jgi:hypothetical protein
MDSLCDLAFKVYSSGLPMSCKEVGHRPRAHRLNDESKSVAPSGWCEICKNDCASEINITMFNDTQGDGVLRWWQRKYVTTHGSDVSFKVCKECKDAFQEILFMQRWNRTLINHLLDWIEYFFLASSLLTLPRVLIRLTLEYTIAIAYCAYTQELLPLKIYGPLSLKMVEPSCCVEDDEEPCATNATCSRQDYARAQAFLDCHTDNQYVYYEHAGTRTKKGKKERLLKLIKGTFSVTRFLCCECKQDYLLPICVNHPLNCIVPISYGWISKELDIEPQRGRDKRRIVGQMGNRAAGSRYRLSENLAKRFVKDEYICGICLEDFVSKGLFIFEPQ